MKTANNHQRHVGGTVKNNEIVGGTNNNNNVHFLVHSQQYSHVRSIHFMPDAYTKHRGANTKKIDSARCYSARHAYNLGNTTLVNLGWTTACMIRGEPGEHPNCAPPTVGPHPWQVFACTYSSLTAVMGRTHIMQNGRLLPQVSNFLRTFCSPTAQEYGSQTHHIRIMQNKRIKHPPPPPLHLMFFFLLHT